jgi:hypothetical protein
VVCNSPGAERATGKVWSDPALTGIPTTRPGPILRGRHDGFPSAIFVRAICSRCFDSDNSADVAVPPFDIVRDGYVETLRQTGRCRGDAALGQVAHNSAQMSSRAVTIVSGKIGGRTAFAGPRARSLRDSRRH